MLAVIHVTGFIIRLGSHNKISATTLWFQQYHFMAMRVLSRTIES